MTIKINRYKHNKKYIALYEILVCDDNVARMVTDMIPT